MHRLKWKLFLAPDGTPGGDPLPDDNPPPTPPTPVKDLDYSKFDVKLNESIDPNNLSSKAFADKAKELGISVDQAKDLYTVVGSSIDMSRSQYAEKASDRCKTALETRWGDSFEVNNNALKRGALKLTESNPKLKEELELSGAWDNPLVAQLVSNVGMMFKEQNQDHGSNGTFDAKDPFGFAKKE